MSKQLRNANDVEQQPHMVETPEKEFDGKRDQENQGSTAAQTYNYLVKLKDSIRSDTRIKIAQIGDQVIDTPKKGLPHTTSIQRDDETLDKSEINTKRDPDGYFEMMWIVIKVSIGPVISLLFIMFVQLLNTYYIGHQNDAVLISGVGMGNMLISVIGSATVMGLNGALETLVSRSFGMSNDETKSDDFRLKQRIHCGKLHNRGRFIATLALVPIALVFVVSDKVLVAVGQDPEVARISKNYACLMIPGVWATGQFDATKKFLSSQYQNMIPVWTQLLTTCLHFVWCKIFIQDMNLKEEGAAIALNITFILNLLITDGFIRFRSNTTFKDMVFFFDTSIFSDIGNYLQIAIPGMLMLCLEWWVFEILTIVSGQLGIYELATEIVMLQLIGFIFMLPLGISFCASALTGNYISQNKVSVAKKFAKTTITLIILLTCIIISAIIVFKDFVSTIFTDEVHVVAMYKDLLPIILVYLFFDTIHGVESGIIRGLGFQKYASIYTLICYYIIGLPSALVFCYKYDMGLKGLWLGFTIATFILDVGFAVIICCPNWQKIADEVRESSKASTVLEEDIKASHENLLNARKNQSADTQ